MSTEINNILNYYFPEPDFTIEQLEEEYENTFRYLIVSNFENKISKCVFLQFFENHIRIERLGKCKLKGGETLNIIELIAKQLENISYISLEDDSTLKVFPEFEIWINLYIYKILTKGQSWYNSLHYYSDNYEQEKIDNAKFKTMTIENFHKYINTNAINKIQYNTHFEKYPSIFSVQTNKNMNVEEFYNNIMEMINNYPNIKKVNWLEYDLELILESNIINYDATQLKKYIEKNGGRGLKQRKRKSKKRKRKRKRKSYFCKRSNKKV